MFTVKICGITSLSDARVVAEAGGDAIGFNFYPQSERYVDVATACAITKELPPSVAKVGVFVNERSASIDEICLKVGLDYVQLHGDEPAALMAELPESISVVRAVRLAADDLDGTAALIRAWTRAGRMPDAVLVDAHVPGAFGGTGRTVDWDRVALQKPLLGHVPLILAGGLTPENVFSAIQTARPDGVDTAGGVELYPGVKDPRKVRQFVRQSRDALGRRDGDVHV